MTSSESGVVGVVVEVMLGVLLDVGSYFQGEYQLVRTVARIGFSTSTLMRGFQSIRVKTAHFAQVIVEGDSGKTALRSMR